jgi:hypothetical protein
MMMVLMEINLVLLMIVIDTIIALILVPVGVIMVMMKTLLMWRGIEIMLPVAGITMVFIGIRGRQ